jgi:elongation factor 1-beta
MPFPANLNCDAGLTVLDKFLEDKSYIEGFQPSQADVAVYEALQGSAPAAKYVHAARWYRHITSKDAAALPGTKKAVTEYGPSAVAAAAAKADDDDIDLFGSDEEEDEELEKLKAQRIAEYNAKKATKPVVIAKSSVVLDVKPWDDTTDLGEMEKKVRGIEMDGLLWGASKIVPIGYGINKLQISLVVEDDKVSMDLLEEQIMEFEDYVQSVDTVSFNKI